MRKVSEVYVSTQKSTLTGETLEVFKNSNVRELISINSFKEKKLVKGLLDINSGDVYFWDIFDLLHKQMAKHLKLDFETCIPLKIDFNEIEGEKALVISGSSANLPKEIILKTIKSSKVISSLLGKYFLMFEKKNSDI